MALDPIVLDDLTWQGMVDATRRRIAAAADGQWTLHAPVDPGVTLLELFAWQLEQRLYRMDQTPDALNLALLAMLGTRPRRTSCAATVLALSAPHTATLARGAEFTLDGAEPALVYSTRAPLVVLKLRPRGVRLWVGERERSSDLEQGRVLALFPSGGEAASVRIELALDEAPPAAGVFSLWLQLRSAASIAPQWSRQAAGAVPPPALLEWLYRSADQSLQPFAVDDGTGGLRRSGVVRLRIPPGWQPEEGSLTYAIFVRTARASFSAPPRLVALAPNAVVARHARRSRRYALARPPSEWLPLPGNVIRLDQLAREQPLDLAPLESACALWLKERDGQWHRWWPAISLHAAGPANRVFIVDRALGQLRFGDGLNGRLPVLASPAEGGSNICLRYLVGGGSAGTAGPSAGADDQWTGPEGIGARNLVESSGGAEAETLEQARQRSAARLRAVTRAVTRTDFEALATATAGAAVARAHAAIGSHPRHPCAAVPGAVTVFVVPDAPREEASDMIESAFVAAPVPDPGLLAAVRARLDAARLITTELFVSAPHYRAVGVRALLRGDAADPSALRRRIHDRLQHFLDPLRGGDEGTGWNFGEPVRVSVILREVQAAAGNQVSVAQVAIGLDGAVPSESCGALVIGPHELVWLDQFTLVLERGAAAAGGLR